MKVEIVNQNQMRVMFKPQDLKARDISATDMFNQGNNKVQDLFREITEMLQREYGFATFGTPLMFEATLSDGGFNVLVTRVVNNTATNETQRAMLDSIMNLVGNMPASMQQPPDIYRDYAARGKRPVKRAKRPAGEYTVFSFDNIDDAAKACSFVDESYIGNSRLYKKEGKYVLLLTNRGQDIQCTKNFEKKLAEFGQREQVSKITLSQLQERAEVVIQADAVNKLRTYNAL